MLCLCCKTPCSAQKIIYALCIESEQLEAAGRSSEQSLSEKEEGEEVNDDGTPMENTASSSSESILSVAMEENGSSRVVKHISPKDIPNFKRKQQQPFYNGPMNGKRKFQPPENGFMPPKKRYRNFYYYEKHSGPSSPPPTFFRKKKPFPKQKPHDYNDHRRPPPYHANRNHSLPYKRSPFWNRKPSPSTKKRFYHRRSNMTEESSAILLTGRDNQWGRHSPPPAFL